MSGSKYNPYHSSRLTPIPDAEEIDYDNSTSGLVSTNVQDAIDEISLLGGGPGATYYQHNQITPASTWNVNHGLSRYPNVIIRDISNNVIEADIVYIDNNNVDITFKKSGVAHNISGYAYFS